MRRFLSISFILLLLYSNSGYAQFSMVDSLKSELVTATDSQKVDLLNAMCSEYNKVNYEKGIEYGHLALALADSIGYIEAAALSLNYLGASYYSLGEYEKTIRFYLQSLDRWRSAKSENGIASIMHEIGTFYKKHGELEEARDYYLQSLVHARASGNELTLSTSFNNLGIVYEEEGQLDSAMAYYKKAQALIIKAGDKVAVTYTMNNIAGIFNRWEQYDSAQSYLEKALEMRMQLGEPALIAITEVNLAELYLSKGEKEKNPELYKLALEYTLKCRTVAAEIRYTDLLKYTYEMGSKVYEKKGDFKMALNDFKMFTILQDSIFNAGKSKEIGKLEAKHEFETAESERKRQEEAEAKQEKIAKSRRDNLQYSGILIFLVLVFAGVFVLGKISIPVRLAEGLIFFSFLLFFEFSLVLLDPYIEEYSSGAPAIKLGFNAVLAALIFPLHSFFETKLKGRLT